MSLFYCIFCDKYRESNEQDHADYSGNWPKCEHCVDDNPKRDGLRLKMTSDYKQTDLHDPSEGGKARPANPIMKYARGYFDAN